MGNEVGRDAQYEGFAEEFSDHAEDGFFNPYYALPVWTFLATSPGCGSWMLPAVPGSTPKSWSTAAHE